jgi:hypothetical protein
MTPVQPDPNQQQWSAQAQPQAWATDPNAALAQLSPNEQAKLEAKKMSPMDRAMVLRDAVSSYLRTNWITGVTAVVCQDFIDECDKAARADSQRQSQQQQLQSQQQPQGAWSLPGQ